VTNSTTGKNQTTENNDSNYEVPEPEEEEEPVEEK
jgi:hypothetical protein